jgi:hypothetical protein
MAGQGAKWFSLLGLKRTTNIGIKMSKLKV